MGEAKRRRLAGQVNKPPSKRLLVPQGIGHGERAPDFGIAMWNAGHRTRPIVTYMRMDVVADYGDIREVSGFIQLDEGRFCVTVQTKQTKEKIFAQVVDDSRMVWAHGTLDTEIVTGDSGETYRMLIGGLAA